MPEAAFYMVGGMDEAIEKAKKIRGSSGIMTKISFDLVSPENLVFNDEVGMIIVPGKDGDLGVLPGHSKVMSSLRPGRVMVYGEDKNLLKIIFCFRWICRNKCRKMYSFG